MFQDFDTLDITSVRWDGSGTHVALGMADNTVLMFNVERQKQVRILRGHTGRVNALSWNNATLSSGGAGQGIMNSDVRVKAHSTGMLELHDKAVCGLAWSHEGDCVAFACVDACTIAAIALTSCVCSAA